MERLAIKECANLADAVIHQAYSDISKIIPSDFEFGDIKDLLNEFKYLTIPQLRDHPLFGEGKLYKLYKDWIHAIKNARDAISFLENKNSLWHKTQLICAKIMNPETIAMQKPKYQIDWEE